jgi:hypothetical protein
MHFFHSSQSLEKFSGQTTLVAHHLEAFMRQIHDTEYPNSVEATEQLLIEQGTDYTKLKVCTIRFLVGVKLFNEICFCRMKFYPPAVKVKNFSLRYEKRRRCAWIAWETSARLNGQLKRFD